MRRKLFTLVAAMSLSFPALAVHKDLKPGWNLFSKDQDVQLGREAAGQVEQQMPIVRDREITAYVQRIGQRLASQPQADKYPYSFKVVADKGINAFALPGGPTYVNTGLIAAADNEAQLAGVMAHEIAHVALRHGTNQASKANLIQLPAMLAGALIGNSGSILGQLAQLGIGIGANSVLLKYSRDAERQADLLGAQMMAQAGYNPIEMARFFEKLQAQGGGGGPEWFSSHPNPGNRMQAIQEEIRTLPQRNFSSGDTSQLRNIQAQLGNVRGDVRGNSADRAISDPSVARPSSRMRELRTEAYSMVYPENWEAFGEQGALSVTLAPRQGIVQSGNGATAIGYGAVVNLYQPRDGQRIDLQHHTHDLITQLQASNPNMRADGDSRRIRVNGQNALVTTLRSDSPFRGGEVDLLVTLARPEGLFYLVFIAPESEYRQVQGVFEQMLRSVRFNS